MSRALVLFVAGSCALSACALPAHVPDKVTTDGLLAIRRGMTYREVEQMIGPPLCIVSVRDEAMASADRDMADGLVAECGRLRWSPRSVPVHVSEAAELSVSYAEPRASFTTPNIYVNFKAGRVAGVYIKKGDLGICCRDDMPTDPFYGSGSRQLLHDLLGR